MIGTTEIVVLAGAALLIFGGKKLPELMRNMGQGVRSFKDGMTNAPEEFKNGIKQEDNQDDSQLENGETKQ